ncbi:hypothetical protein TPHA_0D02050 [Tetrapisispora phaffii CBS 4417]|uniref:Cyclin N-terminal domain-containing protein n=1 Tax=Tetrapisispora phaffii (strain ATCC 24235 / CBS 4417 / NBRC 1672 / NRRL Y-8282 / UCD 70-5) TaxID=1071381 RepID=G8BSM2_TETPH|nr:hypothetical protein TPHA_0D02050 [Tetrapisispora phaffii CBS 4417]CCE62843.1 hypothetical protein TPHA_0D02050 [Tetrapisispora phaffii CBS 4417]
MNKQDDRRRQERQRRTITPDLLNDLSLELPSDLGFDLTVDTNLYLDLDLELDTKGLVSKNSNEIRNSKNVYHTPPYEFNDNGPQPKPKPTITIKNEVNVYNSIINDNDNSEQKKILIQLSKLLSKFSSNITESNIISNDSIVHFITEVIGRSKCNKQTLLLATLYFKNIYSSFTNDKLKASNVPEFIKCIKRTYLSCLIVSHKFLNDNTYSLKSWNKITGLSAKTLSMMEKYSLMTLNFNLHLDNSEVNDLNNEIMLMVVDQDLMDSVNMVTINPPSNEQEVNNKKRSHGEIDEHINSDVDGLFASYLRPQEIAQNKRLCSV